MKETKLKVKINKPSEKLFEFVTNPANTHLWVESIVEEETNEWPVKLGTIYKNKNIDGFWATYIVDEFEAGKLFTLTSEDGNYHVRYTLFPRGEKVCEMEYYEWVDNGELEAPFTREVLEKLKRIVEK